MSCLFSRRGFWCERSNVQRQSERLSLQEAVRLLILGSCLYLTHRPIPDNPVTLLQQDAQEDICSGTLYW